MGEVTLYSSGSRFPGFGLRCKSVIFFRVSPTQSERARERESGWGRAREDRERRASERARERERKGERERG